MQLILLLDLTKRMEKEKYCPGYFKKYLDSYININIKFHDESYHILNKIK